MADDSDWITRTLRKIDAVRGAVGFGILLIVTVALLVAGNTLARVIGAGLLVLCLWIASGLVRDARRLRAKHRGT